MQQFREVSSSLFKLCMNQVMPSQYTCVCRYLGVCASMLLEQSSNMCGQDSVLY